MPVKRYNGSDWEVISGVGLQGPAGADGTAPLSTKGQLLTRTASAVTALGVGTNNQVLTADSAEATGLKWAAPVIPGETWSLIARSSPSGSATSLSISVSGYKKILIFGRQVGTTAGGSVSIRLNGNSTNYNTTRNILTRNTSSQFSSNYMDYLDSNGGSELLAMDGVAGTSNNDAIYNVTVDNLNVAGFKTFESIAYYKTNSSNNENFRVEKGIWANTATVTSIDLSISSGGNLNSGGIYNIYGVVA